MFGVGLPISARRLNWRSQDRLASIRMWGEFDFVQVDKSCNSRLQLLAHRRPSMRAAVGLLPELKQTSSRSKDDGIGPRRERTFSL